MMKRYVQDRRSKRKIGCCKESELKLPTKDDKRSQISSIQDPIPLYKSNSQNMFQPPVIPGKKQTKKCYAMLSTTIT